jgi:hypothetical protein
MYCLVTLDVIVRTLKGRLVGSVQGAAKMLPNLQGNKIILERHTSIII